VTKEEQINQIRQTILDLRSENAKLKKRIKSQSDNDLGAYFNEAGIKSKAEFLRIFGNKIKTQKEGTVDKEQFNSIMSAIKNIQDSNSELSKRVDSLSSDTSRVTQSLSFNELKNKLKNLDMSNYKYADAYFNSLNDKKKLEYQNNLAKQIQESMNYDNELTLNEAMDTINDHYKDNYGHFLNVEEAGEKTTPDPDPDPSTQIVRAKSSVEKPPEEKKEVNIPQDTAKNTADTQPVKTKKELFEEQKEEFNKMSDEEQRDFIMKEIEQEEASNPNKQPWE